MRPAIVFDLEFTAWEGSMAHNWLRPGEFREIVQIGAVKLHPETMEVLSTFDVFVRPRINSRISPYLENLTGITNDELKTKGRDFADAYDAYLAFCGNAVASAFGRDDYVFEENLRLYGLKASRPEPEFRDSRPWFRANGFDTRGMHSCDIGPRLGVPFDGQKHNALADSLSVAAGMKVLVSRGARSLFEPGYTAVRTAA